MKTIRNHDEALQLFEECSIKQAEATETGNYKEGNKNYDIIIACILYLYKCQQLKLLNPFLDHQNVGVRQWAAFALLTIEQRKAENTLKEIMNGHNGIHCGNAKITMREWKRGNLKFPWEWTTEISGSK